MIYIKNSKNGKVYIAQRNIWGSFCNGYIFYIAPVPSSEWKNYPRLYTTERYNIYSRSTPNLNGKVIVKSNIKTLRQYILTTFFDDNKSYYLMPASAARFLTRNNNIFKNFIITYYTMGSEKYALMARTDKIICDTREDMRGRGRSAKACIHWLKNYLSRRLRDTAPHPSAYIPPPTDTTPDFGIDIKKFMKKVKISSNYKISLDIKHLKNCKGTGQYWGDTIATGSYKPQARNLSDSSYIIVSDLYLYAAPRFEITPDITLPAIKTLTYIRAASVNIEHKSSLNAWGNQGVEQWDVGAQIILDNKLDFLTAALHNIKDYINATPGVGIAGSHNIKAKKDIKPCSNTSKTLWLSDNMSKNQSVGRGNNISTGTIINLMLEDNINGNFSKVLNDGTTIYYKVASTMSINFNHNSHPTFVAIISLNPIVESRKGVVIEENKGDKE